MGITAIRFGLKEGVQEDFKKYTIMGTGAFAGLAISEFTGEFICKYAGLSGAKELVVKIFNRIFWWGVLVLASTYVPSGMATLIVAGAGVGAMAGIFNDVAEYATGGKGLKGLAEDFALSLGGYEYEEYTPEYAYEESPEEEIVVE